MRKKDVDHEATRESRSETSYTAAASRPSRRPMTMRDFARVFLGEVSDSLEEHTNPELVDVPVKMPIAPDWIQREEPAPAIPRAASRVLMTVTELPSDPNPPPFADAVALSVDPDIEAEARAVIDQAESEVSDDAHLFDVLAESGEVGADLFTLDDTLDDDTSSPEEAAELAAEVSEEPLELAEVSSEVAAEDEPRDTSWIGAMKRGDGARDALEADDTPAASEPSPGGDRIMNMLSRISPFGAFMPGHEGTQGDFEVVGVDADLDLSALCDAFGSSDEDVLASLDAVGVRADVHRSEAPDTPREDAPGAPEAVVVEEEVAEAVEEQGEVAPEEPVEEEVAEETSEDTSVEGGEVAEEMVFEEFSEDGPEEAAEEFAEAVDVPDVEPTVGESVEEVEQIAAQAVGFAELESLDEVSRAEEVIRELAAVRGVGDVRAAQMHRELGLTKVSDIIEAGSRGELRMLKGVGPKTEVAMIEAAREALGDPSEAAPSPSEAVPGTPGSPNFAIVDDTKPRFASILKRAQARSPETGDALTADAQAAPEVQEPGEEPSRAEPVDEVEPAEDPEEIAESTPVMVAEPSEPTEVIADVPEIGRAHV